MSVSSLCPGSDFWNRLLGVAVEDAGVFWGGEGQRGRSAPLLLLLPPLLGHMPSLGLLVVHVFVTL